MVPLLTHLMAFVLGILVGLAFYWLVDRDQLREAADTGEFHLDDDDYGVIKKARTRRENRRGHARRKG